MEGTDTLWTDLIWWVAILLAALGAFHISMQRTTRAIGRLTVDRDADESGPGVQDAVTPLAQTSVTVALPAVALLLVAMATYFYAWYAAIAFLVAAWAGAWFLVSRVKSLHPGSAWLVRIIRSDLERRKTRFIDDGDTPRAHAVASLLLRLETISPEKIKTQVLHDMGIRGAGRDTGQTKGDDVKASLQQVETIVQAYGAVLAGLTHSVGRERDLPYSKDTIRGALLVAIRATTESEARERLKTGYIELESFVPDDDFEAVRAMEDLMSRPAGTEPGSLAHARQVAAFDNSRSTTVQREIQERMSSRLAELARLV